MAVSTRAKGQSHFYNMASQSSPLVQEEKQVYMKHDQLFKELIGNFFGEFLEVFFPEFHALIDFESIKSISEELFTDLIDGENRRVDLADCRI